LAVTDLHGQTARDHCVWTDRRYGSIAWHNGGEILIFSGAILQGEARQGEAVASGGTNVGVTDKANKRVLVYAPLPATTGARANVVYGRPNLTSGPQPNDAPVTGNTFVSPNGVSVHQSSSACAGCWTLYVSDAVSNQGESASPVTGGPNRVLVFTLP